MTATLPEVMPKLLGWEIFEDSRGFFASLFRTTVRSPLPAISQVNFAHNSRKGTVRGLHMQLKPEEDAKIVTCVRGSVFDVVVDVRRGSPTFLEVYGFELSAHSAQSLFVPSGFAHGYQTLDSGSDLMYLHGGRYSQDSEFGLNPLDPRLSIEWPLPIELISKRDSNFATINADFQGL